MWQFVVYRFWEVQSDSSDLSLNSFLRFEHILGANSNELFGDAHAPLAFELSWLLDGSPKKLYDKNYYINNKFRKKKSNFLTKANSLNFALITPAWISGTRQYSPSTALNWLFVLLVIWHAVTIQFPSRPA